VVAPLSVAPTAVQALEVTQLTLVSTAPATLALDCSAQLVPFHDSDALPFHRSATVPNPGAVVDPTAVHALAAEHETAESTVKGASGSGGVGTIVQLAPFHRSARATVVLEASLVVPTATQLFALAQEAPASEPPLPAGEGSRCQALPSHRSASGKASAAPLSWKPTAVQSSVATQDTAASAAPAAPRTCGMCWALHAVPFQLVAMAIRLARSLTPEPTATHAELLTHDTPSRDPKCSERATAFGVLTIDHPFAALAWTDPAVAPIITATAANASNNRRM
jgi:hypothetical protein